MKRLPCNGHFQLRKRGGGYEGRIKDIIFYGEIFEKKENEIHRSRKNLILPLYAPSKTKSIVDFFFTFTFANLVYMSVKKRVSAISICAHIGNY